MSRHKAVFDSTISPVIPYKFPRTQELTFITPPIIVFNDYKLHLQRIKFIAFHEFPRTKALLPGILHEEGIGNALKNIIVIHNNYENNY